MAELETDQEKLTQFRPLSPPVERSTNSVTDFFMRIFDRGNDGSQGSTVNNRDKSVNGDGNVPSPIEHLRVDISDPVTSSSSTPSSPYMMARSFSTVTSRITNLLTMSRSGSSFGSSTSITNSSASQRPLKDYNTSDFRQYWMPDSRGKECYECQEKFTTFRRRHHCRICGQIFCSRCCKQEIPGRLLGYMGDLRLCNYCCRVVLQYLNSPSGELAWQRGGTESDVAQLRTNLLRTLAYSNPRSVNMEVHHVDEVCVEDDDNTDEDLFDSITPRKLSTASEAWSTSGTVGRTGCQRLRHNSVSSTVSDLPSIFAVESMPTPARQSSVSKSPSGSIWDPDEPTDVETEEPDWLRLIETAADGDISNRRGDLQEKSVQPPSAVIESTDGADSATSSKVNTFPKLSRISRKSRSMDISQLDDSGYRGGTTSRRNIGCTTPTTPKYRSGMPRRAGLNFQQRSAPSNVHYGPLHRSFETEAQKVLEFLLNRSNVNVARWKPVLWPLTQEIAFSVQPQVRSRKDDMEAVRYVHVKTLQSSLIPAAQVVFGTVCTKSVADKRMMRKFSNPSVLVVGGSIEYERVAGKFCPIDPIIMQEHEYLQTLVRRIAALKPQVVVVEKSVARWAQEYCRKAGLTLVYNLKPSVLRRIARSVEAGVAPSVDDQLIKPRVGRCGAFRTETYSILDTTIGSSQSNNNEKTKTLMFFEDCPPDLGCAIILTGPDEKELKLVKKVAKFMIGAAYSSKLEIELLRAYQACIESGTPEKPLGNADASNSCQICTKNEELNVDKNFTRNDDVQCEDESELLRRKFVQRVGEAPFTFSSFIGVRLPYLQTIPGCRCNLRPFFNMERLWAGGNDGMEDQSSGVPIEPAEQVYMDNEKAELIRDEETELKEIRNIENSFDHEFIRSKLTDPADSTAVKKKMAKYRAESGKLFRKKLQVAGRKEWEGNMEKMVRKDDGSEGSRGSTATNAMVDVLDPFLHRRIAVLYCSYSPKSDNAPGFCLKPRVFVMHFYGRFDVTLGDYLERYCFDPSYQCANESCEASMVTHVRKLVHGNCCIEITTQNIEVPAAVGDSSKSSTDLVEQHILCWNWCGICKTTTPATPMNVEFWHLSFARYLEYLFSGKHLGSYTARDAHCVHCLFHQHQHYFAFRNSVVSFKCAPVLLHDVSFPALLCRSKPDQVKIVNFLEINGRLSEKANEIFSRMVDILCGLRSIVQLDSSGTSTASSSTSFNISLSQTISDLQRLQESEQETFRGHLGNAQTVLASVEDEEQLLESNNDKYLTIIDSHTIARHILARCIQQWNVLVLEMTSTLKKKQPGEESRTSLTKLAGIGDESGTGGGEKSTGSTSSPGAIANTADRLNVSEENAGTVKRVSADAGDRKQLSRLLSTAPLISPFDPPEHYAILSNSKRVPIVMRDNEISSIVAFSLASDEYENQRKSMREIWNEEGVVLNLRNAASGDDSLGNSTMGPNSSGDQEDNRSGSGNTNSLQEHIEVQFADGNARFYCKVYYAEKFRLLRKLIYPDGEDAYARSLARCKPWQPKGGKSGANFYITHDRRFILKQLSGFEFQSFLKFAPNYFQYMASVCTENKLSALAKIYGVYRIGLRNPQTNSATKLDLLVMEYLFYNRNISQMYDLKGSLRNRLASEKRQSDLVLLDENLLKTICSNSFYLYPHSKSALNVAITNDSEFLAINSIMDYSLLVGVDEERGELVLGIIDFIRTFTWDKKVESWVKSVSVTGQLPTVVSPDLYRDRFVEIMDVYFPVAPDQWTGLA